MTSARNRRRTAGGPFLLAGAVLLVGLVDEFVGLTVWDIWQWLVTAGLAVAVGLHRMGSTLHGRVRRTVRLFATTAAVGAGLYLAVTIGFLAADAAGLRLPAPLEGLFMVGALGLLVGIISASAGVGSAEIRRGGGARGTGWLVVLVGVLFLSPVPVLLAVEPPDVVPLVGVASLAAVLGVLGLRTWRTAPGDAEGWMDRSPAGRGLSAGAWGPTGSPETGPPAVAPNRHDQSNRTGGDRHPRAGHRNTN